MIVSSDIDIDMGVDGIIFDAIVIQDKFCFHNAK
jgi:hypothetical protein